MQHTESSPGRMEAITPDAVRRQLLALETDGWRALYHQGTLTQS